MNTHLKRTLLARQGIYNKDSLVYGYELLYRNGESNPALAVNNLNEQEGDSATSSVIAQLFTNFDINSIIGSKLAFINFTHNHLIHKIPHLLPKNRIVIEVLETVAVDEPLIEQLTVLKNQGYKIALDDFVFREELVPLIDIANIIKIDVLNLNKQQIIEQLAPIKGFKGKRLAEKIEDKEQFNCCIDLGFDFFQGFYLNRPDNLNGQVITENKAHSLMLLTALNNEDIFIEKVAELILQTPKLSYRILRLANSPSLYTGKKIDSLMDAITLLGLTQIRNWVSLLTLASIDEATPDLIERTIIRAKMCESLSKAIGYPYPHQAYTVGILSTIDVILNEKMSSLLAKLQLSNALNEALTSQKGELGKILKFTIDYETANFSALEQSNIDTDIFVQSYLEGLDHATQMMNIVGRQS